MIDLDLPGSKMVVGDGPLLTDLKRRYPSVLFTGAKHGEELALHYAAASVFVFPSRTDTFGLVLLEALASGLPVAAYPVAGPLDVLGGTRAGVLDENLRVAALAACGLDPQTCRTYAMTYSWSACTRQFLDNLSLFDRQVWENVA